MELIVYDLSQKLKAGAFNYAETFHDIFNHNVVVLTRKIPEARETYKNENGINVFRIKSLGSKIFTSFIPQIQNFGIDPDAMFVIKRIIKKFNIQIIHLHGRFFPLSILTFFLNRLIFKRKIYLTVHGRLEIGLSGFIENIFDRTIFRKFLSKANKIISVSNSLRTRLINFGLKRDKIITIYNGIDENFFSNTIIKPYLRDKFNITKNEKIVLFIGRLEKQKGVKFLLQAIPKVIRNIPDVKFVIRDQGYLKPELIILSKKLNIEKHIYFSNFVTHRKDMPYIYMDTDIFYLPSVHEGFPITIVEALASGLPIVASRIEGIPEAIVDK